MLVIYWQIGIILFLCNLFNQLLIEIFKKNFWRLCMKFNFLKKTTLINISVTFCIVLIAVIYSQGGGIKTLNVFLNTQKSIPIYSVETKGNKIALTFNAAYGKDYTDQIVDILDKNNIKATFFLVGNWVDNYPEKLYKLVGKGHEIGNHSNTHPYFTQITKNQIKSEVTLTSSKIKKLTGINTYLFRAPYGDYNSDVINTVTKLKNQCIQWDVDSLDWQNPGTYFIYNNIMKGVDKGSIILMHTNAVQTPLVLNKIIVDLKNKGYIFVKISELIYNKDFYIDHTGRQRSAE
jgi:peptidoglycan-N-acetylglucosamine deacetylase